MARRVSLSLFAVLLAGCVRLPPPPAPFSPPVCDMLEPRDLVCTLKAKPTITAGSPVVVEITLTNRSRAMTYHLLKGSLPLNAITSDSFVVRRGKVPVRYGGLDLAVEYEARHAGAYLTLAPGGSISGAVDLLAEGYDVREAGHYEIDLPGLLEDVYGGEREIDKTPEERRMAAAFTPGLIYCNRVIVDVVAR